MWLFASVQSLDCEYDKLLSVYKGEMLKGNDVDCFKRVQAIKSGIGVTRYVLQMCLGVFELYCGMYAGKEMN